MEQQNEFYVMLLEPWSMEYGTRKKPILDCVDSLTVIGQAHWIIGGASQLMFSLQDQVLSLGAQGCKQQWHYQLLKLSTWQQPQQPVKPFG